MRGQAGLRSSCEVSLAISCIPRSAFAFRLASSRSTASRSSASESGVTAARIRPSANLYPDKAVDGAASAVNAVTPSVSDDTVHVEVKRGSTRHSRGRP